MIAVGLVWFGWLVGQWIDFVDKFASMILQEFMTG